MTRSSIAIWTLSAASILSAASTTHAQYFGAGFAGLLTDDAVQTRGTMVIKRRPELLRMQVDLNASGKTTKDALAKLKAQREASMERLAKLDPVKGTLKATDPIIAPVTDRQQQMRMMVRQRMRQGGKKAKKATEATPVTVASTISAEWKLSAEDAEARLLEVNALEEKIRASEQSGKKEAEAEASEEMEEEMDEMNMNGYEDPNVAKPGTPYFVYVAKISKADINKGFAEALDKARKKAEQLAQVAGEELGPLRAWGAQPRKRTSRTTATSSTCRAAWRRLFYIRMTTTNLRQSPMEKPLGCRRAKSR